MHIIVSGVECDAPARLRHVDGEWVLERSGTWAEVWAYVRDWVTERGACVDRSGACWYRWPGHATLDAPTTPACAVGCLIDDADVAAIPGEDHNSVITDGEWRIADDRSAVFLGHVQGWHDNFTELRYTEHLDALVQRWDAQPPLVRKD